MVEDSFIAHEPVVYGSIYFGAMALIATWEAVLPRRALSATLRIRWIDNFGLAIINNTLSWIMFPAIGFAFATLAVERGWGFFNVFSLPDWFAFLISFLLLDLGKYIQHYLFHYVPLLWRFHTTHHSDQDYDFTTGFRFHPVEWIVITTMELGIIAAVGAPVAAFLVYEIFQVIVSIMSHGNIWWPVTADRGLRYFVVTPDMHRIHHSMVVRETNSNFSSILPWWDWLFGTYIAQPAQSHETMMIGLSEFRDRKHLTLGWLLTYPLLARTSETPRRRTEASA